MNQTDLFKDRVKALRLELHTQQKLTGSLNDSPLFPKSSSRKITEFSTLANDAVVHVTKLKEFLLKHRKDYIDSSGYLATEFSSMTDQERDLIDNAAQDIIKQCSELINRVQSTMVQDTSCGEQCRQHRTAVIESLHRYLKDVCRLYSEQKAIRVKRIVDKKRVSRLQPEGLKRSALLSHVTTSGSINESQTGRVEPLEETHSPTIQNRLVPRLPVFDITAFEETLTSEEEATFQQENATMMEHMNSLVDEVRQIEGKVLAITKLQETFTEKVLQQADELNQIHRLTVTSTENVREGNEQIRNAIRNQGSLRMWILFILIVCSFTLLFLDWYS